MLDLVDVNGELGRAGGSGPGPVGRNLDHFAVRVAPFDAKEIMDFCKQKGIKRLRPVNFFGGGRLQARDLHRGPRW